MRSRLRPHQTGVLLAGGGMLLISLDSLGVRLSEASSWNVAFWLGVFTVIAIAVLVPVRTGRSLLAVIRHDGAPLLVSGTLQAASTTFFILALGLTTVSNTVVIIAAAPVLAAVFARAALGERTTGRTWVAIGASMLGILIVVSGSLGEGRVEGDLFAVAAITAFAVNLTVWRRYPEMNRMAAIGSGGALMAAIALVPADPFQVGLRALVILALLGGASGPTGRIAVASSTRYLPTAQVSLFTPIETVAATGWAWLFLAETPPAVTVVGGIIVLAAVAYGNRPPPL